MVSSLRTDSPLSRRIVASFLHFLGAVEPLPGQDIEGVEVAAQCLAEVFGIDPRYPDDFTGVVSLIDLFSSIDAQSRANGNTPSAPPIHVAEPSQSRAVPSGAGSQGESLLDQFKEGLELAGFFEGTLQGTPEYEEKLNQAKAVIEEARMKIRSTTVAPNWSKSYPEEILVLAEAFKIQGNRSMSVNEYHTAIQLYTLALSLCSTNAIFHSNRAAALTAIGKYDEAIADCHAAMKLDPLYSKAYSRLGLVYYAQGKLEDAIEKGFKKALELDPSSTSVQENLRAAQQKLEDQQRQRESQQNSSPRGPDNDNSGAGSNAGSGTSFQLPPEIANFVPGLVNMAAQFGQRATQGSSQQSGGTNQGPVGGGTESTAASEGPQVTMDSSFANILPGLLNMAVQIGQRAAQSNQETAGQNQGAGAGGATQPGGVGSESSRQEVPGVTMDPTMLMNAFQQFFGGSGGVAPGGEGRMGDSSYGTCVMDGGTNMGYTASFSKILS
ncbi:hypothetical protein R1sor_022551 [Riccia sorocarpa]|uniref:SGTA homodimerisation domain-containing protein n=1 Tax=Riccia sorocarpa TaxID=122646 RepID=A0ABD3GNC4_9MARC